MDLPSLLTVSEAITRSALERKESRGGHFREDYPAKSEEWAASNIVVRKRGEEMEVARVPKVEVSSDLQKVIEEQG
jgi:succinate dehydrogenase / fumarate reductase flavoprotein subunit